MTTRDVSDTPSGAEPLSTAQRAHESQQRWASAYARKHRVSRSLSWLLAIVLACYVSTLLFKIDTYDPLYARITLASAMTLVPLSFIRIAADYSLRDDHFTSMWVAAWVVLALDELVSIPIFGSRQYAAGMLYVFAVPGIGGVLCYGLHIPLDPSVNWFEVLAEQLVLVKTARGGRLYESIINDWPQAEEIAASWLRRFGYHDAHVTNKGNDKGIDVASIGAVAQVKNWITKRVGIEPVQQLVGAAKPGQACFFFAAYGYTKPALRWASEPDNRVSLFVLKSDGNITACNYQAKRTLWEAPQTMPRESRRPIPFWFNILGILFLVSAFLFFAYVTIWLAIASNEVPLTVIMGITDAGTFMSLTAVCSPIIAQAKKVKPQRPFSMRKIFTIEVPGQDKGFPSDEFVGYDYDPILRLLGKIDDLGHHLRTLRRIMRSRMR